jgi:ADP-heptose:LPS heptosyltransferase
VVFQLIDRRLLRNVAVFRALQLGDLLVTVPAFRALRAALPEATISLIGLPWARAFVERFGRYVDRLIEFPGYPGLPEREPEIGAVPGFLRRMQEERFDLVLQMHGSGGITNPLVALFGADQVAGFYLPGRFCPDPERFFLHPSDEPEVAVHLSLMRFLGVPLQGMHLEFPIDEADRAALQAITEQHPLTRGTYVCIHPGSQLASRRWPVERFAGVARALAARGLHVVLTGTESERYLTHAVAQAMRSPALDLAGQTTLGALGAVIEGAQLVVSNDTSVSHIAAALRVPSVVIASGSDVARWRPLDHGRHRVLWHDTDCRPCAYAVCPIGHPCALGVTVDAVVREAEDLLATDFPLATSEARIRLGAHAPLELDLSGDDLATTNPSIALGAPRGDDD